MAITVPHTWVAGVDYTTAPLLNTLTDAILGLQTVVDLVDLTTTTTVSLAANLSTWQDVTFNTEVRDPSGLHTGSNAYVTIATAGRYQCSAYVAFAANSDSTGRAVRFLVNGTTEYRVAQGPALNSASSGTIMGGSVPIVLAAGDTIKVQAASAAAISTVAGNTIFGLHRTSA